MNNKPISSSIIGFVDQCDAGVVAGWIIDLANINSQLKLIIFVDDCYVYEVLANEYREDLEKNEAFQGTTHAFTINIPTYLFDEKKHWVKVVEKETGYVLNNSPSEVIFSTNIKNELTEKKRLDLALVGEDGWLFLCNDSNDAIGQYIGSVRLSSEQIDEYVSHYEALQKLCHKQDIYYLLTIAPGKEYIYSDFLPKSVIPYKGLTVTESFINAVNPVLDNCILDLKPILKSKKHLGPLNYKSDSHWNYLGAKIAAEEIVRHLRKKFPKIPTMSTLGFNLLLGEESIGDLSEKRRLDYIDGTYRETLSPTVDLKRPVCAIGLDYKKNAIEIVEHPYSDLSKTRPTRLFKRVGLADLPRAIIIRDSYADWLIPFLSEYFSESLFIWARSVDPSVIEAFKPEVIIEEVVDRFLIKNNSNKISLVSKRQDHFDSGPSNEFLTPFLYGISSYIPNAPFLDAEELSRQTGANTGNLLFCHALSRMLNTFPTGIPWGGDLAQLSSSKNRLVIPLANFLGSHIDLAGLADTFRTINIPLIGVGLGIQGDISGVDPVSIPQGSWDWLSVLVSKAATDYPNISLRGQLTFDAINSKGLAEKCVITGCPSNFINPSATLGRQIFRRRANGFRRVAVVAGSPYIPDLIELERSLVKLVESTDGLYVCQHPLVMLKLFKQEYTKISRQDFLLHKNYIHPELSDDEFMQWFRRWSYAFSSVPEWLSFMNAFDVVVGTRIHGVMAGIQAGVPSLCLCIDSRTLELCQTMMIPHVKAADYINGICLDQIVNIFRGWDWRSFDDNRQMLAERFVDFFAKNQLDVFDAPKTLLSNRNAALSGFSTKSDNEEVHQLSTASEDGRYPAIFSALAKLNNQPGMKILSYGCSDGFETTDLAGNYFPNAQIIGCDIDQEALQIARKSNPYPSRVNYIESNRSELIQRGPFDLIVCMAVLCSWPQTRHVSNSSNIYSFDKFSETVGFLSSLLSSNGVLCIYNANYLFSDTVHGDNFVRTNLGCSIPNTQQVRLFRSNGEPYGFFDANCLTFEAQEVPDGLGIIFQKIKN